MLTTVCVKIISANGKELIGRFILDNGSEINVITKEFVNKLKVKTQRDNTLVQGLGNISANVSEEVTLAIQSRISDFKRKINFKILKNIMSGTKASEKLNISKASIPKRIVEHLADPEFDDFGKKIDGLLGVKLFYDILKMERYFLSDVYDNEEKGPYFLNTELGWIFSGILPHKKDSEMMAGDICLMSYNVSSVKQRESNIAKGRKLEEESHCEDIFRSSVKINHIDGKFIVSLPFKNNIIGDTLQGAKERFLKLERRLEKDLDLKKKYTEFIDEYTDMGHLELVPTDEIHKIPRYYLPHHAVYKDSTTTGLRVVFDASFKSSNQQSLNDILYTGEALQNDMFDIIIRFRLPRYGLTADIAKMYRQIWMDKEHTDFQRILWRTDSKQPLQHFRLLTVSYGTSAAPFLAIRCLRQIAEDVKLINECFYMDDLITGADNTQGDTI